MSIYEMVLWQGIATLKCILFHGEYLRDRFKPGQLVALYGKGEEGWKGRGLQINQPQFEILSDADADANTDEKGLSAQDAGEIESLEVGRIVPIYESAASTKLTSRWFRRVIHGALQNLKHDIPDGLPPALSRRLDLLDPRTPYPQAAFPETAEAFSNLSNLSPPAPPRLIFPQC